MKLFRIFFLAILTLTMGSFALAGVNLKNGNLGKEEIN